MHPSHTACWGCGHFWMHFPYSCPTPPVVTSVAMVFDITMNRTILNTVKHYYKSTCIKQNTDWILPVGWEKSHKSLLTVYVDSDSTCKSNNDHKSGYVNCGNIFSSYILQSFKRLIFINAIAFLKQHCSLFTRACSNTSFLRDLHCCTTVCACTPQRKLPTTLYLNQ